MHLNGANRNGHVWAQLLERPCLAQIGLRKLSSHLQGPPFLALKAFHNLQTGNCWPTHEGVWLESQLYIQSACVKLGVYKKQSCNTVRFKVPWAQSGF